MVLIEIVMPLKIALVGPFDDLGQAMCWVRQLLRDNPGQRALTAADDDAPHSLRVYLALPSDRPSEPFLSAVFDLFETVGKP
jgi:hypothetical protein